MKRLSLLISSFVLATAAFAQQQPMSIVHSPIGGNTTYSALKGTITKVRNTNSAPTGAAYRTTAATSRWYSYVDYFDTSEKDNSSTLSLSAPYMWKDTLSVDAYSSTGGGTVFNHNTMVSMG